MGVGFSMGNPERKRLVPDGNERGESKLPLSEEISDMSDGQNWLWSCRSSGFGECTIVFHIGHVLVFGECVIVVWAKHACLYNHDHSLTILFVVFTNFEHHKLQQ